MRKSRYIPITQQPYCCTAACLQMVLYRRGIPLVPQESIAYELGLIVPKKELHLFERARTSQRPPYSGWGTDIQKKGHDIDSAMRRLKLPLRARFYLSDKISSVTDLLEILTAVEAEGCDILVCFDYDMLWGMTKSNGHVCIFDGVEGESIWLIDPEYNVPKYRKVTAGKLYKAIKEHGNEGMGGLWLIESTSKPVTAKG